MTKKVLIAGLGSIGQRHARCLRKIFEKSVELHAFRSRGLQQVINDDLTMVPNTSPATKYGIREHTDLDEALSLGMDAVFVTNPPNLHVETAMKAVESGSHVFIEKPLSHSLDGIEELIKASEKAGVICMIGHQLRYHVVIKKLQEIISSEKLGRLTSAELIFGEYLPGMHPYEDYRTSHATSVERGGGSILSLNHDIDIACYLFGLPKRLFCLGGHYSDLELDAEDTAHILMEISRDNHPMAVHVLLDFIQRPTRREWIITGDEGSVRVDLVESTLKFDTYGSGKHKSVTKDFKNFQRNEMFFAEIRDFFDAIDHNKESPLGLPEAYKILRVAIAARDSLSTGQPVDLD
jgi:predicted dehydrogenase